MKNTYLHCLQLILIGCIPFGFSSCSTEAVEEGVAEKFCLTDTLAAQVQMTEAKVQTVENELVLQGKITFDEDKVAEVFPLVGGFVHSLRANLGDYVKKGQVLAVIRSPEIAGFANQASVAQSNLRVAEKNLQVAEELYRTGTTSELELINAKKDYETAKAEVFRSDEVMSMYNVGQESYYNILAPASGFVVQKDVALNMELRTEDIRPIFVISDLDYVWVIVNIYESDIAQVKEGYQADISTISYPDVVFKGKLDKIFNVIDPESKVLKARIVLNNKDYKLKPEMFANVTVKYQEPTQKLTIPSKSVIFDKNKYFVMVYKDRCEIETRDISIYKSTQTNTYVSGGIKEGEKVLTKHQLLVYDAIND